jgi:tRNA dimethylallyltransferase
VATGPLIVIVGETASGKSALAMDLAEKFDGELICADSWTVYKGFDIGTAKPSTKEQQEVTHHLLNVADPDKGFSVVEFKKLAEKALNDIATRGKFAIMVGGSGLYIDSILFDYGFLPAGGPGQRQELNQLSLDELQAKVEQAVLDTTGIDTRNKRRLVRLIETNGQRPPRASLRSNTLVMGPTVPKEELEIRITKRVDNMFEQGLEREVRELADKYGWQVEPMKGIGYREFKNYFDGVQTLAETRERIISSTMQLAKKQRTWFKRNKSIQWLNDPRQAVDIVTTFLNKIQ